MSPTPDGSLVAVLLSSFASFPFFGRVAGFILSAPPLSSEMAPRRVKAILALVLWLSLSPGPYPLSTSGNLWAAMLSELALGLILGFFVQILFFAFSLAGELIANGMGLSFAGQYDPVAAQSAGPTAALGQIFAIAIFLQLGGLELLVAFLSESFQQAPVAFDFFSSSQWTSDLLRQLALSTRLGLFASAALWASLLLANVLLLISSRLAGGLNLMNSGIPILLALGLLMLSLQLAPVTELMVREALASLSSGFSF